MRLMDLIINDYKQQVFHGNSISLASQKFPIQTLPREVVVIPVTKVWVMLPLVLGLSEADTETILYF